MINKIKKSVIKLIAVSLIINLLFFVNEANAYGTNHLKDGKYYIEELSYKNGKISYSILKYSNGKLYAFPTLPKAKAAMKKLPRKKSNGDHRNYVIRHKSSKSPLKIVATNLGFAITWKNHNLDYEDNLSYIVDVYDRYGGNLTYLSARRIMKYIETADDTDLKIQISGVTGYVKADESDIIPYLYIEKEVPVTYGNGVSGIFRPPMYSARVFDGPKELRFQHEDYDGYYSIGVAPDWMIENGDYYSFDGNYFYTDLAMTKLASSEPYYNYYQYLPLTSKSKVTPKQLDEFTEDRVGDQESAMRGLGAAFVYYQQVTDTNALLVYSMGVIESATGTSWLALNKNNLFGWNAVDSNPIGGASSFESLRQVVKEQMGDNLKGYVNIHDWRFAGPFLGNKASGMNVKYASDPYWGQVIAQIAFEVDKNNGYQDYNAYQMGLVKPDMDVVVKSRPSSNSAPIYKREDGETNSLLPLEVQGLSRGLENQMFLIRRNPSVESKGFYEVYLYCPELSDNDWDKDFGYVEKSKIILINEGDNYIPPSEIPDWNIEGDTNPKVEDVGVLTNYYVSDGPLNVRNKAGLNGKIMKELNTGIKFQGIEVTGGWVRLKVDNLKDYEKGKTEGYVYKEFVNSNGIVQNKNLKKGDINLDSEITITDYVKLGYHVLGKKKLTGDALKNADINGDGKVNQKDYELLKDHLLGNETIR